MKFDLVVFDLGGVLIHVDMNRLLKGFADKLECPINDILDLWQSQKQLFEKFDRGYITPLDFYTQLFPITDKITFEQFCNLYTNIFSVNSKVLQISKDLNIPVSILSNTDELHFGALQKFDIFYHFSKITTSFETHLLKPEVDIYKHVLDKFKIRPDRCVFIDDRIENVNAAQSIGIHAIFFKNAIDLEKELTQLELMNKISKRRMHYAEFGN